MIALACFATGFLLGFAFGMRIASAMVDALRARLAPAQHQAELEEAHP